MPPLRLCRQDELQNGNRVHRDVNGRSVTVLSHNGNVHCIDSACCHMGGPLAEGDIEEIGSSTCIKCPWHNRKFDLATGCQLSRDLEGSCVKTEAQQRVHPVYLGGDGFVWVDVKSSPAMASDAYNVTSAAAGLGLKEPTQQNFGLGFDAYEPFSSQDSNMSSQSQYGSPMPALEPFAGIEKWALATSPVRPKAVINFPGRKSTAAALRRAKATEAVRQSSFEPPASFLASAPVPKRTKQPTLVDLFGKQQQQQHSAPEVIDLELDDMEMS